MKRRALPCIALLLAAAAARGGEPHWAFQPIGTAQPPALDGAGPVDAFLLERLRRAQLIPAREADRRTLVRRVSFDLLGLPPAPEEVEAFVRDARPDAWERLVERLLASPHYGERWARHWLDLVRYADSNGVDENYNHPNAWRYRDYVVRSFNRDTPYDRFVTEQIAGDLVEGGSDAERGERIVATGMLTLGPKILAEQDHEKLRLDAVDEMMDVLTLTTLGVSIGCARCHDHKFDPVPTRDYYAMAGIFRSTEFIEKKTQNTFIAYEAPVPGPEADAARAAHAAEIARLEREIKELEADPGAAGKRKAANKSLAGLKKSGPELPRAMRVKDDTPRDLPVHIRGSHLSLEQDAVPRGVPGFLDGLFDPPVVGAGVSGRLEVARWITDPRNPLTARVMVNRIWQGHFGHGLVRSPSTFGPKGEAPSHPELLDWLAGEFIAGGWSVKNVHRLILHSRAYRMSSADVPAARAGDPDNRLLWRQHRRRLEAEPLRDALLSVAGTLELDVGGKVKTAFAKRDYYKAAGRSYDSNRRSIYLPAVRNHTYELFTLFDHAEMCAHQGRRPATTVPHQALFFMNSPWVMAQADALARRVLEEAAADPERLDRLYALLFARPPTEAERRRVVRFLEPFSDRAAGWGQLCHTLLASNEFIYID